MAEGSYPQYQYLPATGAVSSAEEYTQTEASSVSPGCTPPHVALTLFKTSGSRVTAGVVLYGPNAPSAANNNATQVSSSLDETSHPLVQGQSALLVADSARLGSSTEVYWSQRSGAQWYAQSSGIGQTDLVALLDQLQLDPSTGVATLPGATGDGWRVAPPAADFGSGPYQGFVAAIGEVDLGVSEGPDRTYQDLAAGPGAVITTVRSQLAVLQSDGGEPKMIWQPDPGVTVSLDAQVPMSAAHLAQIAATVAPVSTAQLQARVGAEPAGGGR